MFSILQRITIVFVSLSVSSTVYLYCYPTFHRCKFPSQHASANTSVWSIIKSWNETPAHPPAPFRLLALGDPQLEGDSSLPNHEDSYFPCLRSVWSELLVVNSTYEYLQTIKTCLQNIVTINLPLVLQLYRKRLDLFGNDYYLAHIYHTLYSSTQPTHVTVLGDLLGSQWISDDEFERRGWRFWQRVLQHGLKVEDDVSGKKGVDILGHNKIWGRRVINVAGNHDVGYAGDMTAENVQRFEKVFGKVNWEVTFRLPRDSSNSTIADDSEELPELRIVVLNSLNLDTPALDEDLQGETYNFLNEVIVTSRPVEDRTVGTILLTHLPLHKKDGICVDGPYFSFHTGDLGGGLKEQNHLSYDAGKSILEGIFGMSSNKDGPGKGTGRNGIILTGHDHEGCDVYHHLPDDVSSDLRKWEATRWCYAGPAQNHTIPGIREITVRSMMGEFGGNAGLLSAWFDYQAGEWRFEYSSCSVGIQHIWWAIHVLDAITLALLLFVLATAVVSPNAMIIGTGMVEIKSTKDAHDSSSLAMDKQVEARELSETK
ncbi:hypothetical protein MMC12_004304 [Toensbergia leucococca]|nr:hypothetical protein [Toensbergia leucococca]